MSILQASHGRNLLESVKEIPVLPLPPYFGAPGAPKSVSEEDMGKGDLNTIVYMNIKADNIPSGHGDRIKEIKDIIDLTHCWLDIHAGIQTKIQKEKGTLPTDMSFESQLKRSNYRIKVVDTIMTEGNCGWIALSRDDISTYSIKVDKAEFHKQLLKDVLEGITTVQGISSEVEGVLKSLSENIIKCQDEKLEKSVWAFINVLTWDDVTKEVKGSIRIVWYRVSGEMVEYVVNKASHEVAKMQFGFHQTDYDLVDTLWPLSEKSVKDFIVEYGNKKVREPVDGEITP